MSDDEALARDAERRAEDLLVAARPSRAESARSRRLARLLADDDGRDLLLDLTDQVMRIDDPARSARRLHALAAGGVPASLGAVDRAGFAALAAAAPVAPPVARRLVDWRVAKDTAGVILPADEPAFTDYLRKRRDDGFRLNINVLGEAILGDDEAAARVARVEELIRRPDVDHVSVKISAICANLDVLAWDDSLDRVDAQLTRLYRAARESTPRTVVMLDMEEYRDLELSVAAFLRVLGRDEFRDLAAGIALQAYIPDSHAALAEICAWANARVAAGGAPIRIRIVKGANLANERVEAELHDWPLATYPTKADVDASFKRMIDSALALGDPDAVRLGVASHNLLDLGWALTLRDWLPDPSRIEIEMLEGMAPAQARAVREAAGSLLLYAPVVAATDREASIAYLSRRLDENAAEENFLRALFDITPGSATWHEQAERFRTALAARRTVPTAPRRTQDRTRAAEPHPADGAFRNASDTDFTVAANRAWIADRLRDSEIPEVVVVDGTGVVDELVAHGLAAQRDWAMTTWADRRAALARVADAMEAARGETIAVMARTAAKTLREGDPEVSEAVDFATYAAHLTVEHERIEADGAMWTPRRLVVVAGPWNFPYAIPASGVVHAIAAGCAVILKPAPQTRAVAAALVDQVDAAGLPHGLVQLACTPDDEVGRHLVTHPDVDEVVLTGSYETADLFASWRPDLRLRAETSGKNAIVVTQAADIDQAIRDIVRSAFGHAGQKCSAASLAIVEAPVYDDPSFLRRLADAVRSVRVGAADDLATMMGPLIEPPSERLERALTRLDASESWLVEPRALDADRTQWTPGVRVGVRPGSWFHLTECFGPVLGVMRAPDVDTAIAWQNAVEYGLTGGIQSLDPAEISAWLDRVQVGNAYVNRHITGAIVQRQPFGGWKRSSVGPGSKPGGPAHLHDFGTWTMPPALDPARTEERFAQVWAQRFSQPHDATNLESEANLLRHRPVDVVVLRVAQGDDATARTATIAASTAGVRLVVSAVDRQSDEDLAALLASVNGAARLRLLVAADPVVLRAAFDAGIAVDTAPVTDDPRIELHHWVVEQAIARTMHRHGRLLRTPPR